MKLYFGGGHCLSAFSLRPGGGKNIRCRSVAFGQVCRVNILVAEVVSRGGVTLREEGFCMA